MIRKAIQNTFFLLSAMVIIVSAFTVSRFVESGRSAESYKDGNETFADAPESAVPAETATFDTLTLEEAKEIAASHVGIDSANAVFSKERLDKGIYELKFSAPSGRYEYKVDAADGTILSFQRDTQNLHAAISLELAEEIALNHAGAGSNDVTFTKEKLDETVYELKFSDQNGKYEYEISAVDGTVLDYKWDVQTPSAPEDSTILAGVISEEKARQIALDTAGIDEDALSYLVCYVSWTNHIPTAYEVKFATRSASYHYTIGLDTGDVLGSVCHPHH